MAVLDRFSGEVYGRQNLFLWFWNLADSGLTHTHVLGDFG